MMAAMAARVAKKEYCRFRLAKQQLCMFIMLFCTFLCHHCTTMTGNFLNFMFYGGRECKTRIFFFSFLNLNTFL